jgi:alpha-ketoglutarate-dependent taurine dioxygenase
MENRTSEHPPIGRPGAARRVPVSVTAEGLVKASFLQPGRTLPLVLEPRDEKLDLVTWASGCRDYIETQLLKYGGVLFRNFDVQSAERFEAFARAISRELLEYRERSSPRSRVSGNVYTSTDYPASQSIFLHNENSYQQRFNMKVFFYCAQPAQQGGATPVADCRKVFARISPAVRARFIEKRWMYVRNYGEGFGLPWQTVFQTTDKAVVEDHCRRHDIRFEWKDDNRLRTRAVLSAVSRHPKTGEAVWFNHATFFHVTSLEPWLRDALLAEFGNADELPTNTFYGDGTPIEPEVLDELRAAYRHEKVSFPWRQGDVLLLDNMLAAHGREPYAGERKILVGLAEPFDRKDLV